MSEPHRIRLHGPWILHQVGDSSEKSAVRIFLPGLVMPISTGDARASVVLERSFGCPDNLSERHQVELVIEELAGESELEMNGEKLSAGEPGKIHHRLTSDGSPTLFCAAITARLQPRNILRIRLPARPTIPFRELRLEIVEKVAP